MPWTDWLVLYGLTVVVAIAVVVSNDGVNRGGVRYAKMVRLITEEELEQELDDIRLRTYRSIPLSLAWPVWLVWFLVTDYRRVRRARQQPK